jgi:SAM-dependent methyltransferase
MKAGKEYWSSNRSDRSVNPYPEIGRAEVVESCRELPVLDFGCGVGRLAGEFEPQDYRGVDINADRLRKAAELNPGHTFDLVDNHKEIRKWPMNGSIIVDNVLIHIPDIDIVDLIKTFCECSRSVVQCEHIGRRWRGGRLSLHRELDEYRGMFRAQGFDIDRTIEVMNPRLKANMSVITWLRK